MSEVPSCILDGVGGSRRPVWITVSPVAKVDPVSVGVITFTFGTTGGRGIGLVLVSESS